MPELRFAVPVDGGTALMVEPSDDADEAGESDESPDAPDAPDAGSALACAEGAASSAIIGSAGVRSGL